MVQQIEETPPTQDVPALQWAVPPELGVPADPLRIRLDFFHQAIQMTVFHDHGHETRVVAAADVAQVMAGDLAFGTGLLPANTLWWRNVHSGPMLALYQEPQVRILALQDNLDQPVQRFKIPLPPLVFLCQAARPPWVYAVKKRPLVDTEPVYSAPFINLFANGQSCPGNHVYPPAPQEVPESFLVSFFTHTANVTDRSRKYPRDILRMWRELQKDRAKQYPLDDLVPIGTVRDLMILLMD